MYVNNQQMDLKVQKIYIRFIACCFVIKLEKKEEKSIKKKMYNILNIY